MSCGGDAGAICEDVVNVDGRHDGRHALFPCLFLVDMFMLNCLLFVWLVVGVNSPADIFIAPGYPNISRVPLHGMGW